MWPKPIKRYTLELPELETAARKADRYERAYSVANLYLKPVEKQVPLLDARPAVAVCIVPDEVE